MLFREIVHPASKATDDPLPGKPVEGTQDRLGSRSLRCRSIAMRSSNITGLMDECSSGAGSGDVSPPDTAASVCIARSDAGIAAVRRRMRAVTGYSAEVCFRCTRCGAASIVLAPLSALMRSARSEAVGPDSSG